MVFTDALVVMPTEGFGNRLRMMASCYALAKQLNLKLMVSWTKTNDCNISLRQIFENKFECLPIEKIQNSGSYLFFGRVHTSTVLPAIRKASQTKNISKKYLVIEGGHEFLPLDMTIVQFLRLKHDFYAGLRFHKDLKLKFEQKMKDVTKPYIAVHIRKIKKIDLLDIEKNEQINFERNSDVKSFQNVLKKLKPMFPLVCISNAPFKNWSSVFQSTCTSFSDGMTSYSRDSEEGMLNAVVDFMILVNADLIVGSYYSSFSDEASFFKMISKVTPFSDNLKPYASYHCLNFKMVESYNGLNLDEKTLIKYFRE